MNSFDNKEDIIAQSPFSKEFYVNEIKQNLYTCKILLKNLNYYISHDDIYLHQDMIFALLQAYIREVAMISKFLFPSENNNKKVSRIRKIRAEHLKKYLDVTENSPLKNRSLRDALDHFDERLDTHLSNPDNMMGITMPYVIDTESIFNDPIKHSIYKFFDPSTHVFRVFKTRIELTPITEAIDELAKICFNDELRMTRAR